MVLFEYEVHKTNQSIILYYHGQRIKTWLVGWLVGRSVGRTACLFYLTAIRKHVFVCK